MHELIRQEREKITKQLHVDDDWQRGDADAGGFGPNREDILAFRIEAPEWFEPALVRSGHIECANKPEPVEALYDWLPCAAIDELDNRLGARLHTDIIGDSRRDEHLVRTRRPRFPRSAEKRHAQHHLRRLRIYVMKIDIIIARKIEAPVYTQRT